MSAPTTRKWCTARHFEPDATCELRYRHDGMHRAEFAPPKSVEIDGKEALIAQVVSWE